MSNPQFTFGKQENTKRFQPQFSASSQTFRADFGTSVAEEYKGEYIVTPDPYDQQVLNTAKKLMRDDVTIKKIPFFAVSNASGGDTVYIGSEIE